MILIVGFAIEFETHTHKRIKIVKQTKDALTLAIHSHCFYFFQISVVFFFLNTSQQRPRTIYDHAFLDGTTQT